MLADYWRRANNIIQYYHQQSQLPGQVRPLLIRPSPAPQLGKNQCVVKQLCALLSGEKMEYFWGLARWRVFVLANGCEIEHILRSCMSTVSRVQHHSRLASGRVGGLLVSWSPVSLPRDEYWPNSLPMHVTREYTNTTYNYNIQYTFTIYMASNRPLTACMPWHWLNSLAGWIQIHIY